MIHLNKTSSSHRMAVVSVRRVLHHLTHLKLLVEEPRQKDSDEEVEEEDERRYGSEQEPS